MGVSPNNVRRPAETPPSLLSAVRDTPAATTGQAILRLARLAAAAHRYDAAERFDGPLTINGLLNPIPIHPTPNITPSTRTEVGS